MCESRTPKLASNNAWKWNLGVVQLVRLQLGPHCIPINRGGKHRPAPRFGSHAGKSFALSGGREL